MNINREPLILVGMIRSEPNLKETNVGNLLLEFTLAYDCNNKTDAAGSRISFIKVKQWQPNKDTIETLFIGTKVHVHGNLVQNRWKDRDDKTHSTFEVVAKQIVLDIPKGEKT